ncbi:MAG: hypothetical protein JWP01_1375 [Myxococcales bacterium]|jgi:hypothetical protein|nr:hypothetical protein [Myxococcales bacterium]
MKTHNTHQGPGAGPNQGEGDKISARHYNREVREFVADGKVEEAAREAAHYVESEPQDAARAEKAARKGPHPARVSVDELVAKGRTVIDRVRPIVERVVDRVRSRLGRNDR